MEIYKKYITSLLGKAGVIINGSNDFDIQIKEGYENEFYKRVFFNRTLGLGKMHEEGIWNCKRIDLLYQKFIEAGLHKERKFSFIHGFISWLYNLQDIKGARKNVHMHYDLGNDFFQAFLDSRMVYSCAYWTDPYTGRLAKNLEEAQEFKLRLICEKLKLKKGQRVLEIGCGWLGLAKYMHENYGVEVVAITISDEQEAYGRELCKGLPIEIRNMDYRLLDPNEKFDHVVSIAMAENIGEKNLRTYFEIIHSVLKDDTDDGVEHLFLLHTIGVDSWDTRTDPYIEECVFSGGQVPNATMLAKAHEDLFIKEHWQNIGYGYAQTMRCWNENLQANKHKLLSKYDEILLRRYELYLLSGAASFETRFNNVWQILFSKKGVRRVLDPLFY